MQLIKLINNESDFLCQHSQNVQTDRQTDGEMDGEIEFTNVASALSFRGENHCIVSIINSC